MIYLLFSHDWVWDWEWGLKMGMGMELESNLRPRRWQYNLTGHPPTTTHHLTFNHEGVL